MKRIATLLAILVTSATALFAQNQSIKGSLYDFDTADPMYPAAVQVYQISGTDSTYIAGASTEEDGTFTVGKLKPGNYVLRASFVGYDDTDKNFTIKSGQAVTDLGKIVMTGGKMLEEVSVSAVVAKVQMINDTVMFNSAAYKLPEGSSVEDLIRKLPGVQIGSDGNITVNGKTVSRILVNGKEFFNDDKSVALTQLTADMIEKVKAYEKQSDLARQTGIDDGEEETVLDLSVKKGMAKGWFGNLSLGGGRPLQKEGFDANTLYQVNASLNRFDEDKQFTVMGSASQSSGGMGGFGGGMMMGGGIGGRSFGGGMGGGMMMGGFGGMGGGGGVSTSYSGGANFAMNLGEEVSQDNYKWEVGGSVNWSHNDNTGKSNNFTNNLVFNQYTDRAGTNGSGSNSLSAQMRIEWNKDNYTSLLFQPQFSYSKSSNWNISKSITMTENPYRFTSDPLDTAKTSSSFYTRDNYPYNDYADVDPEGTFLDSLYDYYTDAIQNLITSTSNNESKSISTSGNVQFVRRFGNRGRNISVRGNYNIQRSEGDNMSHEDNYFPKMPMSSKIKNQYIDSPTESNSFNAQMTYSEPIGTGTYLQFSYQFSYSERNQDRATYNLAKAYDALWGVPSVDNVFEDINWDFEKDDAHMTRDENQSTKQFNYNYDQNIQLQFRKNATDQTYNFTAGLTLMPQYTKQNYSGHGIKDTILKRNVLNFTPTLQFRYRVSRQEQINVRYNGRSSQPNMDDLLPILDTTRITSATNGNPTLVPYFTNQFSVGYQKYDPVTMSSFNVNASVNNTLRNITSKQWKINDNMGTTLSQPMNMDGFWSNWSSNLSLTFNITFPDDRFSFTSSTSGSYNHREGLTSTASSLNEALLAANNQTFLSINDPNELRSKTNTINGSENLSFEYRDDYLTASLDGSISYNHSNNNLTTQTVYSSNSGIRDTYQFSYGANVIAFIPWRNMRLATDLNMNSRRGYEGQQANTDELIWNVSGSFSFLKGNKATFQVAFYDLLHQRSNMSYSVSATQTSQSQNTNITSYFMATIIYRLSLFGDRNSRQSLRGRGGMGGFGGGMGGFGGGMGGFGGGMGGGFGGGMPMGGMF